MKELGELAGNETGKGIKLVCSGVGLPTRIDGP